MLSINSWRMIWPRSAPKAARTANSRARPAPRTARRLARLAQAMSKINATAPNNKPRFFLYGPTWLSRSELTINANPRVVGIVLFLQTSFDRPHLVSRLLDTHSRFQFAPGKKTRMHPARPTRHAPHQRQPDINSTRRCHLRRHHSENSVKLIVQIDLATEHRGIAIERARPKPVADHR